jgi:hypothetical protein
MNKVNKYFFIAIKICLHCFVIVDAFNFNAATSLFGSPNVDSNVDKEEGRLFYSSTLVVNNSTVIRAVTFIIGSLLIFLPILLVVALKLGMGEEGGGTGYCHSGSGYHEPVSTYSGNFGHDGFKRKRKSQEKTKNELIDKATSGDDKPIKGRSQSKLFSLVSEKNVNIFVLFF